MKCGFCLISDEIYLLQFISSIPSDNLVGFKVRKLTSIRFLFDFSIQILQRLLNNENFFLRLQPVMENEDL